MIARAHYWLLRHPRVGRPLVVAALLQLLSMLAVSAAPGATAATNSAVLNWTGLHDNYGVPIGDYYLSLASLPEQLVGGGPDASVADPSSWVPWLLHGLDVLYTNFTAINVLTAEAGVFVGIIALSLWVMRLTVSAYWLTVFGELTRAITTAVIAVTTRWGLVAITVPLGVFLGVLAIRRGEAGRGATMILLAILMPALAISVFSDPAGMMYGPDGMLMFGRRMGFSTAEAVTHNGALSGEGLGGQVDTLTSSLITHVVREPLQVFNFGHVVDHVGTCGAAYSAALRNPSSAPSLPLSAPLPGPLAASALQAGNSDAPIRAMKQCADHAAVHYAQSLDGTNVFVGAVLVLSALLFGWFMISSGASVFMVSVKAIYTTAKLLPSVFAGGISGPAQQHAKATVWRFFKHPLEVTVLISFVSVMGLATERLISRPLPAELGGANPFAHILIMCGASVTGLYLLRHIRADLQGHHPGHGMLGRAADVALGMGMHAAMGGAGKAALGGLGTLRGKLGSGKGATPWDKADMQAAAGKAGELLGPAQEGFAPITNGPAQNPTSGPDRAGGDPAGAAAGPGAQQALGASAAAGSVHPVGAAAGAAVSAAATTLRPRDGQSSTTGQRAPSGSATLAAEHLEPDAAEVQPIGESPAPSASPGWDGEPPLSAYADPGAADIPLPPAPPDDASAPPPPQDPGPSPASVDPITAG